MYVQGGLEKLVTTSSCSDSAPSCIHGQAYIGVFAGDHDVVIDYDFNDGKGRQRAAKEGCHPDVACPRGGCQYVVAIEGNPTTLYAIIDGQEQPSYEVSLPYATCKEEASYLTLDVTQAQAVWSERLTMGAGK